MSGTFSNGRQRRSTPLDSFQSSSSPSEALQGFVRIKSIEIYGTAFASDCTPCDEGYYTNVTGSSFCLPCPADSFSSEKGSVTCSSCDSITSYSPVGSTACIKRPICDMNDLYMVKTSCVEGKQTSSYKWIEPKICHDVNNIISKVRTSTIPCNSSWIQSDRECSPGMELVNGKCSFCPPNYYNDGSLSKCQQCPPSSLPLYELVLNTWKNELDPDVDDLLNRDCFSTLDPSATFNDCQGNVDVWKAIPSTEGSYIRSSEAPLDSILMLRLSVPGFRHSSGGQLVFDFSLIGTDSSLQLYELKGKTSRQIGSWVTDHVGNGEGIKVKEDERREFRHFIRENVPVSFTWIYQRTQLVQSHVKIYSMSVGNSLAAGATSCSSCTSLDAGNNQNEGNLISELTKIRRKGRVAAKGTNWNQEEEELDEEDSKCIPCPSGQYLSVEGQESRNLVTFSSHPSPFKHEISANVSRNLFTDEEEKRRNRTRRSSVKLAAGEFNAECLKCPPGFIINSTLSFPKGIKESCIQCGPGLISNSEGTDCMAPCQELHIDGDEYTLTGLKYPLTFQATELFTASGMKYFNSFNISLCGSQIRNLCVNNATSPTFSTTINVGSVIDTSFSSLVCRSTMVPDGEGSLFSTRSVSLANKLMGITREAKLFGQEVIEQFSKVNSDLHFFFEPTSPTFSCKKGRSMIITLRCDPSVPSDSQPIISAPSSCPLGTCDGCSFNLLIRSNSTAACRTCRETDYDTVIGECINGVQHVHLINPKNCIIDLKSKKSILTRHCSVLPQSVQLFLTMVSFFAIVMSVLLIHCWKKNQKLEYNYSKLVENKNTSESCMEDEDEEPEGSNEPKTGSDEHQSLRQKIISSRNEVDYSGYETIQLTKHMQEDIC